MTKLFKKKCIACSGDMSALKEDAMKELNNQIQNWNIIKEDQVFKLTKYFKFENFEKSLSFINQVSIIAETEAQLETARANEATARANESAARARENTRTESSRSYAPGYDPNVAAAMNRANELEKANILLNLGQALRTPPAGPKFNAPQKQLNCRVNPYNNRITCY